MSCRSALTWVQLQVFLDTSPSYTCAILHLDIHLIIATVFNKKHADVRWLSIVLLPNSLQCEKESWQNCQLLVWRVFMLSSGPEQSRPSI